MADSLYRRTEKIVVLGGFAVLFYFMVMVLFLGLLVSIEEEDESFTADAIALAREQGSALVVAVDSYHESHGELPESLDVLVAVGLIENVPVSPVGHNTWEYRPHNDHYGHYVLEATNERGNPSLYYQSSWSYAEWHYLDGF